MLKKAVSEEVLSKQRLLNSRMLFSTSFNFLLAHNGIRPNSLHGLMGTTGCGKSTLLKTVVSQCAEIKKPLIWLSEETVAEYQIGLEKVCPNREIMSNLRFVEEKRLNKFFFQSQEIFLSHFEDKILGSDCDAVFIDNLTTSFFYSEDVGIKGQRRAANFLSDITKRLNIPIIYVAHTDSRTRDNQNKLIEPEDVRGNKQIVVQSEYLYIMQICTIDSKQYSFLRVRKHRWHPKAKGFYLLGWEKEAYRSDEEIPFYEVKKIFKQRDTLGR